MEILSISFTHSTLRKVIGLVIVTRETTFDNNFFQSWRTPLSEETALSNIIDSLTLLREWQQNSLRFAQNIYLPNLPAKHTVVYPSWSFSRSPLTGRGIRASLIVLLKTPKSIVLSFSHVSYCDRDCDSKPSAIYICPEAIMQTWYIILAL